VKSFTKAFTEFLDAQFLHGAKPHLIFLSGRWVVTWYYSKQTIDKMGGEIIL
jgi:hypothetical protein